MRNKVDKSVLEESIKTIQTHVSNHAQADAMEEATVILPPNSLLLGPHTVARDKNNLIKLGVSSIVSMTAECPAQFPDDFGYFEAALVEETCTIEDILNVMDDVYEFCIRRLNQKETILIHCVRGKTRSAAAATYVLAKMQHASIHQTYETIQQKRDIMIPDDWLEALQTHL